MLRLFIHQIRSHRSAGVPWTELKYFFRWKRSLAPEASSVKDEQPWITFAAIDLLKKIVDRNTLVFEYGGGGSTLFFVKRAKEVVTVEHNAGWYQRLSSLIAQNVHACWKGFLIEPAPGDLVPHPDMANPAHYSSEDKASGGYNFRDYACRIDQYPDEAFDLVLVDGRSRPSCMAHAIPKIRRKGYLVLDNSDRSYYLTYLGKELNEKFIPVLDRMGASPYTTDFTKTSIWQKK